MRVIDQCSGPRAQSAERVVPTSEAARALEQSEGHPSRRPATAFFSTSAALVQKYNHPHAQLRPINFAFPRSPRAPVGIHTRGYTVGTLPVLSSPPIPLHGRTSFMRLVTGPPVQSPFGE